MGGTPTALGGRENTREIGRDHAHAKPWACHPNAYSARNPGTTVRLGCRMVKSWERIFCRPTK